MNRKVVLNIITAIVAVVGSPFLGAGLAAMIGFDRPSFFSRALLGLAFVAVFCYPMQLWFDRTRDIGQMSTLHEFGFRFVLIFLLHFILTFGSKPDFGYGPTALMSLGIALPVALLALSRSSGRRVPPPVQRS